MHPFPATPTAADAPADLFESGHCWLLELVDGAPLRFQLQESGLLRFGDRETVFDPDDVPPPYRHAVRHVREHLDREALRAAVPDVTDVTVYGVATHRRTIDYDWDRLPSFLGTDVWSGRAEEFRPPDAAEAIVERLGLAPVTAVERELPARDFDPDSYAFPDSAWYDGPVAGVVVRKKGGGRAVLQNPAATGGAAGSPATDATPADLAAEYATPARFERLASDLDDRGRPVTADALAERAFEAVVRAACPLLDGDRSAVDPDAVRAEVGALARAFVAERPDDAW